MQTHFQDRLMIYRCVSSCLTSLRVYCHGYRSAMLETQELSSQLFLIAKLYGLDISS